MNNGTGPEVHERFYAANRWQTPRPICPTEYELTVYRRCIGAVAANHPGGRMLILGSTPELRDLALAAGLVPVACDHSRQIWESMSKLMRQHGPEEFLNCNWLELPEDRTYEVIAGDGSFVMLAPEQLEPMLRKISRLLRPEGVAVFKVGARSRPFPVRLFAEAVAEYRHVRPAMPLYYYLLYLVTEIRSENFPDLTVREVWERHLFPYLTPDEIAGIRPKLVDARFYTPPKAEFDAMVARHFTVEEVTESPGIGRWGNVFMYVLRSLPSQC
mgnify:CR=1 FL=1